MAVKNTRGHSGSVRNPAQPLPDRQKAYPQGQDAYESHDRRQGEAAEAQHQGGDHQGPEEGRTGQEQTDRLPGFLAVPGDFQAIIDGKLEGACGDARRDGRGDLDGECVGPEPGLDGVDDFLVLYGPIGPD